MTAKKLKGQTLIEIVLSLGLATSVIVAIVILAIGISLIIIGILVRKGKKEIESKI